MKRIGEILRDKQHGNLNLELALIITLLCLACITSLTLLSSGIGNSFMHASGKLSTAGDSFTGTQAGTGTDDGNGNVVLQWFGGESPFRVLKIVNPTDITGVEVGNTENHTITIPAPTGLNIYQVIDELGNPLAQPITVNVTYVAPGPPVTLYFGSDVTTVNGLVAYSMTNTNTSSAWNISYDFWEGANSFFDSQVSVRHSNGTETVIGAWGTAWTARYSGGGTMGMGLQSATWTCPATTLASTDCLVIRHTINDHDNEQGPVTITFCTQQNPGNLVASTWTFYRQTEAHDDYDNAVTTANYYGGSAAYPSRVEGIIFQ